MIHIAFDRDYASELESVALIKIKGRVRKLQPLADRLADAVQKLQIAIANERLDDITEELKTLHDIATQIRFGAFGIKATLPRRLKP